jgi:MFS family permease
MASQRVWRLVPALGVTQIISWGTLYYSIAVLGASMRTVLEVSAETLFGAYSLSLLIAAVVAPSVGRAIDRHGGRLVMSIGSVVAAVALLAIADVHSALALYAAWSIAGLAMAMTMYDAAFATLSQHSGASYRSALTALTLMGGLASTVFWPASLKGLEWYGWRETLVLFAALQFCVCLPLHLLYVPPASASAGAAKLGPVEPAPALSAQSRRRAFVALAIAFALNGFIVSVLTVHMVSILQRRGLTLETAVWVGSFFGPLQVAGRIVEFTVGRRFASRTIGIIALALLVVAVCVLIALDGEIALALVFALLFGFSNGVVTIVRGTMPAEVFGRAGYGRILGSLAAPALLARAVAPLAFAPLASVQTAAFPWLLGLLVMAVLSALSFALAVARGGDK